MHFESVEHNNTKTEHIESILAGLGIEMDVVDKLNQRINFRYIRNLHNEMNAVGKARVDLALEASATLQRRNLACENEFSQPTSRNRDGTCSFDYHEGGDNTHPRIQTIFRDVLGKTQPDPRDMFNSDSRNLEFYYIAPRALPLLNVGYQDHINDYGNYFKGFKKWSQYFKSGSTMVTYATWHNGIAPAPRNLKLWGL